MTEFFVAAMVLVSLSSIVVGDGGGVFPSLASGMTQPNCRYSASVLVFALFVRNWKGFRKRVHSVLMQ